MVNRQRMGAIVVAVGVVAAWGAARFASCVPLIAVVLLVAALAVPPRERRFVSTAWVVVALAALAVSWAVALDHELALRHTLLVVLAGATFALARHAGPSDRALGVLAAALAATAVLAVVQVSGGFAETRLSVEMLAPELRERALERLEIGRATGAAALPGHFAILLVMAAPLLAAGAARATRWRRVPWVAALALAAAGVVLSRSLAAVIVVGALAALAVATRWRSWQSLAAIAGAILVIGIGVAALRADLGALEPLRLRWTNWRTTAWVFANHPLLGVGLGGVGQAGLTAPAGAANITPYAHNTYLQLAAELGVAGMALAAALVIGLARLVAAGAREHPPLALAVAALPLHNLIDFSAYAPEVLLPWAVLAGALAARVLPLPERALPSFLVAPVLGATVLAAGAAWRAEVLLSASYGAPPERAIGLAIRAARWSPWSATPMLAAAGTALGPGDPRLTEIDREVARRWWVRPYSSAWAEMRARSLLASGRRGEALVWAREARRRAPFRSELEALEAACRARS